MKKLLLVAAIAALASVSALADNANPSVKLDEGLVSIGKLVAAGYKGKTAVITGAASGMGKCASETLCEGGATVYLCDINAEGVKKVAADINAKGKGKAIAVVCDVRNFEDAERSAKLAIEGTGRIDLLICFAGGNEARVCGSYKKLYEQPKEVLDWGLDVNLRGPLYFARACMPYMIKAKSGVIVTLGSVTGFECDASSTYGITKAGLDRLALSLAMAGAPYGVRAFCVAPGPVMTRPGMAGMQTALGFQSEPQELVDFILYLSRSRSITGTTHVMDCGRLCLGRQASAASFLASPADKK